MKLPPGAALHLVDEMQLNFAFAFASTISEPQGTFVTGISRVIRIQIQRRSQVTVP
jgi:hypothetical protein